MAKRDESLLDLMADLPWWVSVIVAALSYACLKYLLPAIPVGGAMDGVVVQVLAQLAPLIAAAFLLSAFVSAVKSAARRRRQTNELRSREAQGIGPCPKCGSRLVLRTARRGANAGGQFWGCSSFPRCRYVQPSRD